MAQEAAAARSPPRPCHSACAVRPQASTAPRHPTSAPRVRSHRHRPSKSPSRHLALLDRRRLEIGMARAASARAATRRRSGRDGPPRRATAPCRPSSGRCRRAARRRRSQPAPPTAWRASAPHGLLMNSAGPPPLNALSGSGAWLPTAQHQRRSFERFAAVELDPPAIAAPADARTADWSKQLRIAAQHRFIEDVVEIARRIAGARRSRACRRLRPRTARRNDRRLAGPGAHPSGADVEQMRRLARRIGHARAPAARCRRSAPSRRPRRASWAAAIVPEKPPPMIATGDRPVRCHSRTNSPASTIPPCSSGCIW